MQRIKNGIVYVTAQPGANPSGYNAFCDRMVFCKEGYTANNCGGDVKCVPRIQSKARPDAQTVASENARVKSKKQKVLLPNENDTYTLVYNDKYPHLPVENVTNVVKKNGYYDYNIGDSHRGVNEPILDGFYKGGGKRTLKKNRKSKRRTKSKKNKKSKRRH
jgi:hypothetical protein